MDEIERFKKQPGTNPLPSIARSWKTSRAGNTKNSGEKASHEIRGMDAGRARAGGARAAAGAKEKLRYMEKLDRGLVAVQQSDGRVFLSWRLLASDPDGVAFNVYRETERPRPPPIPAASPPRPKQRRPKLSVNLQPLTAGTWLLEYGRAARSARRAIRWPPSCTASSSRAAPRSLRGRRARAALSLDPAADAGGLHAERRLRRRPRRRRRVRDRPAPGPAAAATTRSAAPPTRRSSRPTSSTARCCGDQPRHETSAKARTTRSSWSTTSTATAGPRSSARPPTARSTARARSSATPKADSRRIDGDGHVLNGPEYLTVFDGPTGEALATARLRPARRTDDIRRTRRSSRCKRSGATTTATASTASSPASPTSTASARASSCAAATTRAPCWPPGTGATAS